MIKHKHLFLQKYLVVGLCVWSKSFKGKATLQSKKMKNLLKQKPMSNCDFLPPQKLIDTQQIPMEERKDRAQNDFISISSTVDFHTWGFRDCYHAPMQSSEHHFCRVTLAGNLPKRKRKEQFNNRQGRVRDIGSSCVRLLVTQALCMPCLLIRLK